MVMLTMRSALFVIALTAAISSIAGQTTSPVPDWARLLVSGPVSDARCNMDVIHQLNEQHLHKLLQDISNTTYFRLFGFTNTGNDCPLTKPGEEPPGAMCGPPPGAADGFGFGGGGSSSNPFGSSATSSASPPTPAPTCSLDAEPLTDIMSGIHKQNTAEQSSTSKKPRNPLDHTISRQEVEALELGGEIEPDCNDESKPSFWLNMCDKLAPASTEFVNLQRNPESFTGYNGTEVWRAIYEENCFSKNALYEMCYEERVLYRLLSGMHASINIHISENYRPPMKGKRTEWESKPERFMSQFGPHPDRINNLHFAFVVLLRALQKAAPAMYNHEYVTGDLVSDQQTQQLIRDLMDSKVMAACEDVFEAFDESLMFQTEDHGRNISTIGSLKRGFKDVFHNISGLMDCVTCEKCKLHGRVQLLGLGTALKVLLVPAELLGDNPLGRNEIVALVNTIAKFSHAIVTAPKLMEQYWANLALQPMNGAPLKRKGGDKKAKPAQAKQQSPALPVPKPATAPQEKKEYMALDLTVGAIAQSSKRGYLSERHEHMLLSKAIHSHADTSELLVLGKHYGADHHKFALLAVQLFLGDNNSVGSLDGSMQPDVVIVGGGLGGLSAALAVLDRGGRVVILDKETIFGGNSAKASSGINGVDDVGEKEYGDSVDLFTDDVVKGSKIPEFKNNPLVRVLTEGSRQALEWLRGRVGIPLELRGQLGGHSVPRTHRPANGMAGAEMVAAVKQEVMKFTKGTDARCKVMLKTEVVGLATDDSGRVNGVKYRTLSKDKSAEDDVSVLYGANVILATGGFANDFGKSSLIRSNRPDLLEFSTTNGKFATGDGHKMAMAGDIGAAAVDMENIQLHPTGFVDRRDPEAKVKTLCAEILRGVGGVLVDSTGARFANELGTRDYISSTMQANAKKHGDDKRPKFGLVINAAAAAKAEKHIATYTRRSLLVELRGIKAVAEYLNVPVSNLQTSLQEYDTIASAVVGGSAKADEFGKTTFPSLPFATTYDDKNQDVFYVGEVAPVLHYCMGGLKIDKDGRVLRANKGASPIDGLFAVGEITGGIHGKNRLGGNALTECVVFGFKVGSQVALHVDQPASVSAADESTSNGDDDDDDDGANDGELRSIVIDEVNHHNSAGDLWVVIKGLVYDFTDFADDHPGGKESIVELAGKDGTKEFYSAHTDAILEDFDPIGRLA